VGRLTCTHDVNADVPADVVAEAASTWAFDNEFRLDAHLPNRLRFFRQRARLAFLHSFDILDYPLTVTVKLPYRVGRPIEVVAEADVTGTLWTSGADRRKLTALGASLASAIARASPDVGAADAKDRSHHDEATPNPRNRVMAALAELGYESMPPDWQTVEARYRELVRKYHPDRYAAQDLPPEMMNAAVERFKRIAEAYELLKGEYQPR
jgi:hypothetical protein